MKNNYFLRWTQRLLFLLTIMVGMTASAQSFIVSFPDHAVAPTQNPRNLIVSNGSSLLKVRLDVAAVSTTGASVTIQLPTGVEYLTGSVTKIGGTAALTITENGGGANAPNFTVGPNALVLGQFIEFTIARRATCASQTAALSGTVFNDIVNATITGNTTSTGTTSAYQVTYPVLSFIQPTTLTNAVLGQAATRTFTINNGGNGAANAIHFSIHYPANSVEQTGLQLTSGTGSAGMVTLTPTSTTGTVATGITYNYTVTAAQLSGGGFDFGETLTFTESYIVRGCSASTAYSAGYGENPVPANWCQAVTGAGAVSMAADAPNYSAMTTTNLNFVNMCTPWDVRVRLTNGGTGNANAAGMYNIMGILGMNWYNTETDFINQTQYTISNVRIGTSTAIYTITGTAINGTMYIDMSQFTTDPDGPGIGLDDLDGDGFYDDLPAGQYIDITYNYQFNCSAAAICTANIVYHGPVARLEYDNMCGTHFAPNPRKDGNVSPVSGTGNYFGQGLVTPTTVFPPQITGSVNPGDESFMITFSAPMGSSNVPNTGTGMFVWEVTLPTGVSIVGTPQIVHPVTFALSPATYTQAGQVVRFEVPYFGSQVSPTLRNLQVEFEYLCGAGGNLVFNQKLFKYNDYANDCKCFGDLLCNDFTIQAICPSPCPAGPTAFQPEVRRTDASLGYADYNLTTQRTAAELSPTSLKTALFKHQIQITGSAIQNNNATNMHVELELDKTTVGNLDKLTPISAQVTVTRGGTVINTCNLTTFTTTGSTATKTVMDLDITSCFTGGVLAGDEVEVVAIYEVATNTGLPITRDLPGGAKWRFYNYNASGSKDFCLDWTPEMYLVGTTLVNAYTQTVHNASGCATFQISSNPRRVHGTGGTYFPSEIIPFAYWNSIEFTLPAGYEFVSLTNIASSQPGISPSSSQYSYTNPTIVGDVYTFTNDGSWPIPRISHSVEYSDQRWLLNIRPTCASNTTTPVVNFKNNIKDFYYSEVAGPRGTVAPTGAFELADIPYNSGGTNTSINYNTASKPTIAITNQSGTIQAATPSESFVVRMASTGTTTAPYTWLAIPTVPGITITQVEDIATSTVLTPSTYAGGLWYPIDAAGLATGTFKDYRVSFTYTTCNPIDVNVIGGWNCSSFPTNPDDYTCGPAVINSPIHIVPQQAEVQINKITEPTNVSLCDPMLYEYRVNSAGAGNTIDNTFTITLPTGSFIVPGSVLAEYPVGSSNWQPVTITTSGSTIIADLTSYINYPVAGLPGTITDGGNSTSRLMGIRFQVNTNCDFVVNSRILVSTSANRTCGAPATGDGTGGPSLNIGVAGVVPSVTIISALSPTGTFDNCSAVPVVFENVQTVISTAPSAGAISTAQILIPEGYDYVVGSYVCNSTICATFNSVFTAGNGDRYILLDLPSGLNSGDVINYDFAIQRISNVACGDYEVMVETIDRVPGIACSTAPGGICPSLSIVTGRSTYPFTINKPALEIQSVTYTRAIPACGSAPAVPSSVVLSVENTSAMNQTNTNPNNPVIVHFYAADAMGQPTGAILGTYTMTGPIAAGTTVTETASGALNSSLNNLVAVINNTDNCVCSPSQLVIDIAPIATCDTAIYTVGTPVTVSVLTNDTTGDVAVPSTVSLVAGSIPGATCTVTDAEGDCTTVTVPGEGVWTVDPTTGAVTFTPEPGFTGTPSPIQYNVEDAEGNQSNDAWINIDLMPIATDDTVCMATGSSFVTVTVLTNDTTGDVIIPSTISLVALPSAIGIITDGQGDITQMTIPGEGTWSVNAGGQVIFTPVSGFTGNPTPVQYNGNDAEGNVSNNATVTITTVATPVSGGNQTVCATSPIQTLTATAIIPAGQTITWYDAATGGNVVAMPTLSTIGSVTYYAEGVNGACTSPTRTPVTLTLQPAVAITISPATPGTVCVGGTTTLTATPAGGTWTSNSPNAVVTQNNADGTAFVTINGTGDFTFNYSHPGVAGVSCANSVNNVTLVTGVANPATPIVTTTVATCSAAGTASITNYNASLVYTFAPSGPTVGAGGVISSMLAGQSYTVTAATVAGNCTSLPSAPFSVQPMLVTPAVPTVGSVTQPTCSVANGTFVITNYSSANTYSITSPSGTVVSGPTATGLVTVTAGSYTVTSTANGCTSAPVVVVINALECADIVTVKTDNQTSYVPGQPVTYIITVTNNGPTAATNVNVVDNAPAGTTFTSWSSSNGSGTGNINDTIATLAVGQTITYTVNVNVPATMLGNLVNTVTVTTPTPDPVPGCTTCTDIDTPNTTLAVNDVNNTYMNIPVSGSVLTNDSDPQGHAQTVTASTTTTPEGTLVLNADGTYTFTPATGFTGTFVHTYTVCDSGTPQACDTATLTIEVLPIVSTTNDVVANNDTATTSVDQPVTINILSNDFDPNGDTIGTPTIVTPPSNGTFDPLTGVYIPNPGFVGVDTFVYQICDNGTPQACDTAVVTITIVPTNITNETYANDDAYNGNGPTITGNILNNDTDPEGNTQFVTSNTQPQHGTVVVNLDGTFVYTPTPGYYGPDSFVYTICDNGTPQACDTATVYLTVNAAPAIVITKDSSLSGNVITYTYLVTNTGNVPLTGVSVLETAANFSGTGTLPNPVYVSSNPSAGSSATSLAVGATSTYTATYTLTQADIDAGQVDNLATASGIDPTGVTVTDDSSDPTPCPSCTPVDPTCTDCTITVIPQLPLISITKDGTLDMGADGIASVGDVINYVFTVQNTGNVTLTNVTVADINAVVTGGPIPTLAVGATDSTTFTATHVLTQADIDAGYVYNLATATGNDPNGDPVTDESEDPTPCTTCPVDPTCPDCTIVEVEQEPAIVITKDGTYVDSNGNGVANVGDVINYVFTVQNTGNVTLTNVTVADINAVVTGGPLASLAVGATDSTTFTATHVLTQADIDAGYVYNLATATGNDPNGDPVTDESEDPTPCTTCPVDPTCPDCTIVEVEQEPAIAIVKEATFNDNNGDGFPQAGETITYTFTVTNTGNMSLFDVIVTDPLPGIVLTGGPIDLAVGQSDSTTFTATYTITQADIVFGSVVNQATASAETIDGEVVDDLSDDDSELEDDPTIVILEGCKLTIFNAVSPNGDGSNDIFYIQGIECYPNNTVEVYNRWGIKVYEVNNYDNISNVFKGYSDGRVTISRNELLPTGTYFYIIKYVDLNGNGIDKSGYLYIQNN